MAGVAQPSVIASSSVISSFLSLAYTQRLEANLVPLSAASGDTATP
jgi:hypothetical protein